MTVGETDGRKAIGVRNREAILEAALTVLQSDPDAGMNQIADGAKVGRATLYRHFPTREDLLSALRQRARQQGKEAMLAANPDEGDPIEALERIVAALIDVGFRNRVLFGPKVSRPDLAKREEHFEPIARTFARAQRDGIISTDFTVTWLTNALRVLLGAARVEGQAGRMAREDAPALIVRQLVEGARKR